MSGNSAKCIETLARKVDRRAAIAHMAAGSAAAIVAGTDSARAQDATPGSAGSECVATAPPLQDGIGFVQLLVGGIVHDMPSGPVEVRISRLAMAPGTLIEAAPTPHPALMYIETGVTACPGGAGRIGYAADGTVIEVTEADGVQYTPAGATQYIPANVPDGAGNEGDVLMSSIIIEFVPAASGAAGTPTG
jgi:hypothetical protein